MARQKKAKILKNKRILDQTLAPIAIPGIILLGAALRIYELGVESYALDEVNTALIAQAPLQKIIIHSGG